MAKLYDLSVGFTRDPAKRDDDLRDFAMYVDPFIDVRPREPYIDTKERLIEYFYPHIPKLAAAIKNNTEIDLGNGSIIKNATITTSDAGLFSKVVGAQTFLSISDKALAISLLDVKGWSGRGARIITGFTKNFVRDETGDATGVTNNLTTESGFNLAPVLKRYPFEWTRLYELEQTIEDAVKIDVIRSVFEFAPIVGINEDFTLPNTDANMANTTSYWAALDKIIASNKEFGLPAADKPAAGNLDYAGIDRDAGAGFWDAQVVLDTTARRVVGLDVIDDIIKDVVAKRVTVGNPNLVDSMFNDSILLTGPISWMVLTKELRTYGQFNMAVTTSTVREPDGLRVSGTNMGGLMTSYGNIPLHVADLIPKTGHTNASAPDSKTAENIYFINRSTMATEFILPPMLIDERANLGISPISVGKFIRRAEWAVAGNVKCYFPVLNGKAIGLSTA